MLLQAMHTTIGQQTEEMQGYRALLCYPQRALQSRILQKIPLANRLANTHHILIHYATTADIEMAHF